MSFTTGTMKSDEFDKQVIMLRQIAELPGYVRFILRKIYKVDT